MSGEFQKNLWAPWRLEYIAGVDEVGDGCFLCHYRDRPDDDAANAVVWRTPSSLVVLNRWPYTNGHLLVAPTAHKGDMGDLTPDEWAELMGLVQDAVAALQHAVHCQGFNIGLNIGRCAGAGLPEHLHIHVVPRWSGDTNFMPVFGQVRVIPQAIEAVREKLLEAAEELGLPRAGR